jgi:hypothetical protein
MLEGYYISGALVRRLATVLLDHHSHLHRLRSTNPLVSYIVPGLLHFPRLGVWLRNTYYQWVNSKMCSLHVGCWFIPIEIQWIELGSMASMIGIDVFISGPISLMIWSPPL